MDFLSSLFAGRAEADSADPRDLAPPRQVGRVPEAPAAGSTGVPPAGAPPAVAAPASVPVHVLEQDAKVLLADGMLVIERPETAPVEVRLEAVASLSVHGRATVTTPCIHALLEAGIPLVWRSQGGFLLGQTTDVSGAAAALHRRQFAAQGGPEALDIARRLVAAKIVNMRGLVRRRLGTERGRAAARLLRGMGRLAGKARASRSVKSLLGHEGAATAAYFQAWPQVMRERGLAFNFSGRTRRPPRDPANALLSYLYAVLTGECAAAAAAAGLDATQGFLHVARPGRPALALDLAEPFRPLVVDAAVLAALNTGEIGDGHFACADDRVSLNASGRKAALRLWERRLASEYAWPGGKWSYRAAIARLALAVAQRLRGGGPLSVPERP